MAKQKKDWIALYGNKSETQKPKRDWIKQYGQKQLEQETQQEPEGVKGIGQDILSSLKNSPEAIWEGVKHLPGEFAGAGKQLFTDPSRLSRNLLAGMLEFGQDVSNTPRNIADYLAKKKLISEETAKKLPRDELNIAETLGIHGQQPGDTLLRALVSPETYLGELGQLNKLGRAGARFGAGAGQAIRENENPITGGLSQAAIGQGLETGINGLTSAPRVIKNLPENIKTGVSNVILNRAKNDIKSGGSFTPEQAVQNALTNYTNIEGKPMGADFGTLIGNKKLQDIYNASSKIPFSGGRAQLTQLDKQLFDKKEALAKIEHDKKQGELSRRQQKYEEDLRTSISDLNHARDLEQHDLPRINNEIDQLQVQHNQLANQVRQAPEILNSFAHPELRHADYLKQEGTMSFQAAQTQANQLYEPVNSYEFDPSSINKVEDFPHYLDSLRRHHTEASALRNIFGHSEDLGRNVNKELNSALTFINSQETPTLGAILEHTRALGRMAEYAREAGKRHEASTLMEMRRSLKEDAKDLLDKQGASDVAEALEDADAFYISNVLPWYSNKEVRKSVTDRNYRPDSQKFARAIHGDNAQTILQNLSPEARKAAIFELISRNSQTPNRQTTLTSEEIGNRYRTQLDPKVKQALTDIDPNLNDYFESLSGRNQEARETGQRLNRLDTERRHLENRIESMTGRATKSRTKAEEGQTKTEENRKEANTKLQEAMKERFGKPKVRTKSIFAALKNFSPLNAAGLGTALYAMGHLNPTRLAEMFGGSVIPAKGINKILTELETEGKNAGFPKLLAHYFEGTKVTNKKNEPGNLETTIKKSLTKTAVHGSYSKKKERKPMELELIGKRR